MVKNRDFSYLFTGKKSHIPSVINCQNYLFANFAFTVSPGGEPLNNEVNYQLSKRHRSLRRSERATNHSLTRLNSQHPLGKRRIHLSGISADLATR
ncbi:hypothetical protein CEXT_31001 [Caerostris extrusa]|uniref:Uncharacterized protein n=1 Tax=Caerostris extrusa TaxID=172846 RepID=A0AAV4SF53_CAEEX|nr:hypothetical protein CEXT_31001 [Caerostris extrusa]